MANKGFTKRFDEAFPSYSEIAKGLGERIIDYRGRHQLTQTEFGKLANVTKQTISEIERGRHNLSRFTVVKINHILEEDENHD